MSEEQEEKPKVPVKMEPAEKRVTFQMSRNKHSLAKTLKKLDKNVDAALSVVLEVIADPEADAKVRLQAAQYIIDTKVRIDDTINKEMLTRQIAEVKMLQAQQQKQVKVVSEDTDEEGDTVQARFEPNCILRVDTNTL